MAKQSEWRGYLPVMLAAACWAYAGTLAKYMMNQAIPALVLVEMRVTIAAGILLAGFWLKNPRFLKIKPSDLPYLGILGVVGVTGVHYDQTLQEFCNALKFSFMPLFIFVGAMYHHRRTALCFLRYPVRAANTAVRGTMSAPHQFRGPAAYRFCLPTLGPNSPDS